MKCWKQFTALVWAGLYACSCVSATATCPHLCDCSGYMVECINKNLTRIPRGIPSDIHVLHLQGNRFKYLNDSEELNFPELHVLDLRNDHIMTIDDNVFSNLKKLTHLYMSENILTGDDFNALTFNGLEELRVLDLSHNPLATFESDALDYVYLPKLTNLDLSHGTLRHIDPNGMADLKEIERIDLSYNELTDIYHIFKGMKTLSLLDLSHNHIKSIAKDDFADLKDLTKLNISHNSLSSISEQSFNNLVKLTHLYIHHNQLETVPTKPLGHVKLQQLDLSNNPIGSIGYGAFPYSMSHSLHNLTLNNMPQLERIENGSFVNLLTLQEIQITNCSRLIEIQPGVFNISQKNETTIERVNLRNNQLKTLSKYVLPWLQVNKVLLGGNPWYCDCHIEWMIEYLPDGATHLQQDLKCSGPSSLRGKTIQHLEVEDFAQCTDTLVMVHTGGMAASIIVIVVIAVVAIGGVVLYRLRYRMNCCYTRPGQYTRVMYDIYDAMEPDGPNGNGVAINITPASDLKDRIIAKNEHKQLKNAVDV